MPGAVVKLIADHDRGPPEQRVERISDLYLASQDPGIMRSRRRAAASHCGDRRHPDRDSAKLNGVDPQAWLTDVLERIVPAGPRSTSSTSCCRGTGRQRQPSTRDDRGAGAPLTVCAGKAAEVCCLEYQGDDNACRRSRRPAGKMPAPGR